jgi:hypothetical protein
MEEFQQIRELYTKSDLSRMQHLGSRLAWAVLQLHFMHSKNAISCENVNPTMTA